MTATILAFPRATRSQPADPTRAAIRQFVNALIYHPSAGDGTATVTVPLRELDLLMAAAVDEGGA